VAVNGLASLTEKIYCFAIFIFIGWSGGGEGGDANPTKLAIIPN